MFKTPEDHKAFSSSALIVSVALAVDPTPFDRSDLNKLSNVLVNKEKLGSLLSRKLGTWDFLLFFSPVCQVVHCPLACMSRIF